MTKIIANQENLSECLQIANNGNFESVSLRLAPFDNLSKIRWDRMFDTMLLSVPVGWVGLEMESEDVIKVFGSVVKSIFDSPTEEEMEFARVWAKSIKAQTGI